MCLYGHDSTHKPQHNISVAIFGVALAPKVRGVKGLSGWAERNLPENSWIRDEKQGSHLICHPATVRAFSLCGLSPCFFGIYTTCVKKCRRTHEKSGVFPRRRLAKCPFWRALKKLRGKFFEPRAHPAPAVFLSSPAPVRGDPSTHG